MTKARGRVSIWLNKVPLSQYPASYFEEQYGDDDAPICPWAGNFGFDYYDHDFMDVARTEGRAKPIGELVERASYADTFKVGFQQAAKDLGFTEANHAILLYDFDYSSRPNKISEDKYMRFLGTFDYEAS